MKVVSTMEDPICSICLENLAEADAGAGASTSTPCHHTFHTKCLTAVVRPQCPLCKSDIGDHLRGLGVEPAIVEIDDEDDEEDDDEEPDPDEREQLPRYKEYLGMVDHLFDEICDGERILARRDFTCCTTCSGAEIRALNEQIEDDAGGPLFDGYICYHAQDTDRILDQMESNDESILVHLGWGLFQEAEPSVDEYNSFAHRVQRVIREFNEVLKHPSMTLDLKYDVERNIDRKLELHVHFRSETQTTAPVTAPVTAPAPAEAST